MQTEALSTLEREARQVLDRLRTDKTALILADDGSPAAYLIDPQTYQTALHRLELLEAISQGEQDLAEGRTLTHEQVKEKMSKWLK